LAEGVVNHMPALRLCVRVRFSLHRLGVEFLRDGGMCSAGPRVALDAGWYLVVMMVFDSRTTLQGQIAYPRSSSTSTVVIVSHISD
jgi:hypothetical protein